MPSPFSRYTLVNALFRFSLSLNCHATFQYILFKPCSYFPLFIVDFVAHSLSRTPVFSSMAPQPTIYQSSRISCIFVFLISFLAWHCSEIPWPLQAPFSLLPWYLINPSHKGRSDLLATSWRWRGQRGQVSVDKAGRSDAASEISHSTHTHRIKSCRWFVNQQRSLVWDDVPSGPRASRPDI